MYTEHFEKQAEARLRQQQMRQAENDQEMAETGGAVPQGNYNFNHDGDNASDEDSDDSADYQSSHN